MQKFELRSARFLVSLEVSKELPMKQKDYVPEMRILFYITENF